jgi:hypothetical protein
MANPDPIKLTKKGDSVILCGQRVSDNEFVPLRCNDAGELVSTSGGGEAPSVPSRTPLAATITLDGTPKQLSTATGGGATSAIPWRLKVPAGGANALFGTQAACVIPIQAGTFDEIDSSTLAGWWAKSDGAAVDVTLLGAENA